MTRLTGRILSHVALVNLEGRYGVQGSDIQSLYLYFSDFLEKYSTDNLYRQLAYILKDLAKKTEEILALDCSPDLDKLIQLSQSHAKAILKLNEGESYYLPGGWNNRDGCSHAMIFAWTKNQDSYDFCIYNGGAGIEYHDEIASISSPQCYPVKIYNMTDLNESACQDVIQLLIVPQVVHVAWRQDTRFFDSQKFYARIQVGMTYLNATHIEASTRYSRALSTQGITSGTCAQASIQQMVKIFLNDINAFQTLMVNYKYHTMMAYVSIYPRPYSKALCQLFEKSLDNLMKIVETSDAFSDADKESWFDNIMKFRDNLTHGSVFLTTTQPIKIPPKPSITHATLNLKEQIQSLSVTSKPYHVEQKSSIENHSLLDELNRLVSMGITNENEAILEEAIDKLLMQLPLPESPEDFASTPLPFYAHFTRDQWEIFTEKLDAINNAYDQLIYGKKYIHDYVTRWSLFSLIDYAICQQTNLGSIYQYSIHQAISPIMQGHQWFFQRSFFLATRNPAADRRLLQIQRLYPPSLSHLICDNKLSINQKIELALNLYPGYQVEKVNDYMLNLIMFVSRSKEDIPLHQILFYLQGYSELDYFRRLLRQYPEQKKMLEDWYENYHNEVKYSGYYLEFMSSLPEDIHLALSGIVYVSEETREYFVKGMLKKGKIPKDMDLENLGDKFKDAHFKKIILDFTTQKGHTLNSHQNMHCELEKLNLKAVFCFLDLLSNYSIDPYIFEKQTPIPKLDNSMIESMGQEKPENKLQQIRWEIKKHPLFSFFEKQYRLISFDEDPLVGYQRLLAELGWLEENHFKALLISLDRHQRFSHFVYFCFHKSRPGNMDYQISPLAISKHNMLCFDSNLALLYTPSQVLITQVGAINPTLESILGPDVPRGKLLFDSYSEPIHSNHIACQDRPYKIKQWQYLSLSNDFRALLTLSYFSTTTGIGQLTDPNAQTIFEVNLMHPYSLIKLVENNAFILRDKIGQITKLGMDIFQYKISKAMDTGGVFLFRLQYIIYRYLYLFDKNQLFENDLINLYQELESSLTLDVNQSINTSLSFYYFLTGMFLLDKQLAHPVDLKKLFHAYVAVKYDKDNFLSQLDELTRAEFQCMQKKFQAQLMLEEHSLYKALNNFSQKRLQSLPNELVMNPLLPLLGISEKTTCLVSPDEKEITFINTLDEIKFINHQSSWIVQRNGYQLALDKLRMLPLIYQDKNTLIWLKLPSNQDSNQSNILIERHGEVRFISTKSGHFTSLDRQGELTYDEQDLVFAQFEDFSFIISLAYPDGRRLTYLERYQLNFEQHPDGEIIFLNDPTYRVLSPEFSPFGAEVACLVLENRKNNTKKCMLAKQLFFIDYQSQPEFGGYYPIIHDKKSYVSDMPKNSTDFCYKDAEQYATYDINQHNVLLPQSTSDALYLCYVYMATHQIPKAWILLDRLSLENAFGGQEDEYKMLYWITTQCPVFENVQNKGKRNQLRHITLNTIGDVTSFSAEHVACQLKALSLLCMWYDQGHEFSFPKGLNQFKNFLEAPLVNLYQKYQKLRRELPVHLLLNDIERLSLFNRMNKTDLHFTSFEYEYKQLKMKYYLIMEQKLRTFGAISQQQIKSIERDISNLNDVWSIDTKMGSQEIALNRPYYSLPDTENIFLKNPFAARSPSLEAALKALSIHMSAQTLETYFFQYALIASQPEREGERVKLLKVLVALLSLYQDNISKNLAFTISTILYRMIHAPEVFETLKGSESLLDLFNLYHETPAPPPLNGFSLKRYKNSILIGNRKLRDDLIENMPKLKRLILPQAITSPIICTLSLPEKFSEIQDKAGAVGLLPPELAGQIKMEQRLDKIKVAEEFIQGLDFDTWLNYFRQQQPVLQDKISMAWEHALNLAQQLPDNLIKAKQRQRKIKAQLLQPVLNQAMLLSLYLHQEYSEYQIQTALDDAGIMKLQQTIHEAVTLEIISQWLAKLIKFLQNGEALEILEYLARKNIQSLNPVWMSLQRSLGDLLYPHQIDALIKIISPPSPKFMLSLPMGSGKTKVILPLLSHYKANGCRLAIIVTPQALLKTNYHDFQQIILNQLGKKVFLFEFNAEFHVGDNNLSRIYEQFETMITYQQVLVTSPESLKALALKYKEFLHLGYQPETTQSELNLLKFPLFYLHQILRLLQNRADVITDEGHLVLSPSHSFCYTIGSAQYIYQEHIELCVQFQRYIYIHQLNDVNKIIQKLLDDKNSPLMLNMPEHLYEHIERYLRHQMQPQDASVLEALTIAQKNRLAFYRLHLCAYNLGGESLYEKIQNKRLYVDYGPSLRKDLSALQKTISIPYNGNNESWEGSRFCLYWVTIHCTIRTILEIGISKALLKELVDIWLERAANDRNFRNKFYADMRDLNLEPNQFNFYNEQSLSLLLERINQNYEILLDILKKEILPLIEIEALTLSSDAYHFVDMFDSLVVVSGTLGKKHVYHPDFILDASLSNGNNEYLLKILKNNSTQISAMDFHSPLELLQRYYQKYPLASPFSAIIDISARFAGVPNLEVAEQIADFVANQQPSIRYVLYFDKQNSLCALSVGQPRQITILGESNPNSIFQKLDQGDVESYVIYFDQVHTLGIDIQQKSDAFALVLTDDQHEFFQGCARMRGLESGQKISMIIPKDCSINSLDDLVKKIEKNINDKLRHEQIRYTTNKLENIIHTDLMNRIYNLKSQNFTEQIAYANAFQRFLIKDNRSLSLYETHGAIPELRRTKTYFEDYAHKLIDRWTVCLQKALIENRDSGALQKKMQEIIDEALPYCAKDTYDSQQESLSTNIQSLTNSHSLNASKLQVKQKMVVKIAPMHNKIEDEFKKVNHRIPLIAQSTYEQALNTWCKTLIFDPNLFASNHFMFFYKDQLNPLEPGLKPIHCIYCQLQNHVLSMHLITIEEADAMIANHQYQKGWLTTLDHTVIAGQREADVLQSDSYQRLIEQIYFFNGMLLTLRHQANSLRWIYEANEAKLAFYETQLIQCRNDSKVEWPAFKKVVYQINSEIDDQVSDILNQAKFAKTSGEWKTVFVNYFRAITKYPDKSRIEHLLSKISPDDYRLRIIIGKALLKAWPDLLTQIQTKTSFLSSIFSTDSTPVHHQIFNAMTQRQSLKPAEDIQKIKKLTLSLDSAIIQDMLDKIVHLDKHQHDLLTEDLVDFLIIELNDRGSSKQQNLK